MSRHPAGALVAVLVFTLVGCAKASNTVTEPEPSVLSGAGSPSPSPSTVIAVPPPSGPPSVPASPSFDDLTAVACAGHPAAEKILALLRDQNMIGGPVTVQIGPLCAGAWQYLVITQSGREPLQVVTRWVVPGRLELVTAGTDVCTVTVTTEAPAGIRTVTHC